MKPQTPTQPTVEPKGEAWDLTKAIAYTENGGKPDIKNTKAGKTGETKSVFQFEPATWSNYSKQVFGKVVPETPDAETYVVQQKVTNWLKQGNTPQQILSMWNAGVGEPNAYTGKFSDGSPSVGTNEKYGVEYNVPEYVDKGMNYLKQFSDSNEPQPNTPTGTTQTSTPPVAQITPAPKTPTSPVAQTPPQGNSGGALSNILAMIKGASAKPSGTQSGLLSSANPAPQQTA